MELNEKVGICFRGSWLVWLSCALGSFCGSCGCGGGVTVPVALFSLAVLWPPVEVGGRSSRWQFPAFPRAARKAPSWVLFLSCSCSS